MEKLSIMESEELPASIQLRVSTCLLALNCSLIFVHGLPEEFLNFDVAAVGELDRADPGILGNVELVPFFNNNDGFMDLVCDFERVAIFQGCPAPPEG